MKKSKEFLVSSLIIFIVSLLIALFYDIKSSLIILFFSLLISGYFIYKEKIGQEMIIAFLFSFAITSYYVYEYSSFNIMIGKINLFPLVSWTFGLVFLREIYERLKEKKFLFITLFYLIGLFLVEYLGYYLFNIKLNTNYPSLFNLGIIHAPVGMKFFYVLAGPVYILITDYLKVK